MGAVSEQPAPRRTRREGKGWGEIMSRAITIRLLQLTQLIKILTANVQR